MDKIELGVEVLLASPEKYLNGGRVGLICNQASVDHDFAYTADRFHSDDQIDLRVLFGPQHGIRGDVQDNMVETGHGFDPVTGLRVYSLYSETRTPTAAMLEEIDVLVCDLQDIGGRVYTFIYTMANAMKACAEHGKRFVVLDRPNPIGGIEVEGNLLEKGHESFVGQFPIPMRHGMTAGELAQMFNDHFGIGCELTVVQMKGWRRECYFDETDAPWVLPSPNMPTVNTAIVFPGTVFFEGTEVSEGRGTTRPFELIGAPFVEADKLANHLNTLRLPGVYFRPTSFMPAFQKHAGRTCGGVFLHVTDRQTFRPVAAGIAVIRAIYELYDDKFQWKQTAYEYEFDRNPFDVIAGTKALREIIESGTHINDIRDGWVDGEKSFVKLRSDFLIYD